MGELSPWHLLIVVAAFMLLFGANKLPQMARSVGQSMRIFKAETRALSGEKDHGQLPSTTSQPPQTTQSSSAQTSPAPSHQAPSKQPPLAEKPPVS
jgi:sec-independent protein translocase protein TatA